MAEYKKLNRNSFCKDVEITQFTTAISENAKPRKFDFFKIG